MYRGNHPAKIDEKGRLKIPVGFKHLLDEKGCAKFFITSLDGTRALIYSMDEWEKVEAEVMRRDRNNPHRNHWLRNTNYYGQETDFDTQGRLLIPALLRETADLRGDVDVLGMSDYLEVVNHEYNSKQVREKPFTDQHAQALSESH